MVRPNTPFLLTVMAEEVGALKNESETATSVELALLIEDKFNDPPVFNQDRYNNQVSFLTDRQ